MKLREGRIYKDGRGIEKDEGEEVIRYISIYLKLPNKKISTFRSSGASEMFQRMIR